MKNIHSDRIHLVQEGDRNTNGNYILYWMSLSIRSHWNYALEYAVGLAEEEECSVVVLVNVEPVQEQFTERHLRFFLEGVSEVASELAERNIRLVLRQAPLGDSLKDLCSKAKAVVTDFPYLDEDKNRLGQCCAATSLSITAIEGNVVVPVEAASDHQEYAARTLRKDIMGMYEEYLEKPTSSAVPVSSLRYGLDSWDTNAIDDLLAKTQFSLEAPPIQSGFQGGFARAKELLENFLRTDLEDYEADRQSPTDASVSFLSPYLARGMVAPAYLVRRIHNQSGNQAAREGFLEELIVRRGLAHNFVHFSDPYDQFSALPEWARETLEAHKEDSREHHYTREEFEFGETHDAAWNESMRRIRDKGYLHNHMRMYWGKQVLAWSNTPRYALKTLLYLNNKYFLDGNDPNSYANCLWVFGLHDRAWGENEVFGKVRLMNHNGLERKINVEAFVNGSA